jgi:hypothetical protein
MTIPNGFYPDCDGLRTEPVTETPAPTAITTHGITVRRFPYCGRALVGISTSGRHGAPIGPIPESERDDEAQSDYTIILSRQAAREVATAILAVAKGES